MRRHPATGPKRRREDGVLQLSLLACFAALSSPILLPGHRSVTITAPRDLAGVARAIREPYRPFRRIWLRTYPEQ
jgi:hypothetical protein